jgi:peptide/nickel transport system permease protein
MMSSRNTRPSRVLCETGSRVRDTDDACLAADVNGPDGNRRPLRWSRRFAIVLHSIWSQGEGRFALIVLSLWLLVSLVSVIWTPHALWETDGYHAWAAPSVAHLLGTDGTGADTFSWLMAGGRTDLVIAALSVALAGLLGVALLMVMISRSKVVSAFSVVVVDALISIPTVLIALVLSVPMGASIAVVVIACGVGYGLNLARIARPQALMAAGSDYVASSRANGASSGYILIHHVLPNALPSILVQLSLSAGTAILAESGLTYLGVGVPSGVPSWGHSLSVSVKFIDIYPLTVLWPGLTVTVVVVALNVFGDVLREAIDPTVNEALREVES